MMASNGLNMQNMRSFSAANSCGAPKQLLFRFTKQWSVSTGEATSKMHKMSFFATSWQIWKQCFLRFRNMIDYLSIKSFQFKIFVLHFTLFLSCVWLEAHIFLANIILTFPQVTLQWPHSPRSHLQAWRTSLKGRNVTTLLIRRDKSLVNREIKITHTI